MVGWMDRQKGSGSWSWSHKGIQTQSGLQTAPALLDGTMLQQDKGLWL
jgi:hypothetical protein